MKKTQTMIQIEDKILSIDIIEEKFVCDVNRCQGYCCVHGESGAPLEDEEVKVLDQIFPVLKKYLRPEGINAIKKLGTSLMDADSEMVTPLINNMECAYAIFENGIARCAIEKAYEDGRISFRKPLSCHIYPIRAKKYVSFEALNYDRWHICDPARTNGNKLKVPIYVFVKDAILRKYGSEFFNTLNTIAEELSIKKPE